MSGSVSRNVKLLKNQDKPFSTIVKYGPDMLHTQEVTDSSSVVSTTAVQIHVICTVFSFLRTLWSGLLLPFFSDPNRDPYGNMERNGPGGKSGRQAVHDRKIFALLLKSL